MWIFGLTRPVDYRKIMWVTGLTRPLDDRIWYLNPTGPVHDGNPCGTARVN